MKTLKVLIIILWLLIGGSFHGYPPQALARTVEPVNFVGKWTVKFSLSRGDEHTLLFEFQPKGLGSFLLLNPKPDDSAGAVAQPAVWAGITNERVSFSGHLELQLGTCCREVGTLIFKGKPNSNNSMTGKLIFVTSVEEDESPYKFRSEVGTFTATRVTK
jgi:hypothetical protein